ncbi:MAG: aryl-sulfate sulfotransferase [Bacteroidota bacterium]
MKVKVVWWTVVLTLLITACTKEPALDPDGPFQFSSLELEELDYVPLSRRVSVKTNQVAKISIKVVGKNGPASDVYHEFNSLNVSHTFDIHGLYPDYENTVLINFLDAEEEVLGQESLKIQTDPLREGLPTTVVETAGQINQARENCFLVSYRGVNNPMVPFMMDQFGDIRWVMDMTDHRILPSLSYDVGMERLENGNWYFGETNNNVIYEVNMAGEIIKEWALPGYGFHHNVQEISNGNFLVTVSIDGNTHDNGNTTIEDGIVEVDRNSGAILQEWNLLVSLDEYRVVLSNELFNNPIDWVHVNAVIKPTDGEGIVVSGRDQGVVHLNFDNEVQWILGNHNGWGSNRNNADLNQFLLNPLDANGDPILEESVLNGFEGHEDFDWPWFQHAPVYMPNGDLLLFDNGTRRYYNFPPYHSRAVIYRIDETNMTVQEVWEYGADRPELFSDIVSDVDYLEDEDVILIASGRNQQTQSGFNEGRIIKVDFDSKNVLYEARIIGPQGSQIIFHRAEQLSIYPD